jgi:serpin B
MQGGDGDEVVAGAAQWPTFLSKVAHTAVVKMDDVGTEAAAVCAAMRGGGGPLPDLVKFTADHPFTFFIMEERSGVIVFTGHVLDPTK